MSEIEREPTLRPAMAMFGVLGTAIFLVIGVILLNAILVGIALSSLILFIALLLKWDSEEPKYDGDGMIYLCP